MSASIEILGSCFTEQQTLRRLVEQSDYRGLVTFSGNYSLIAQDGDKVTLVGSCAAPPNLFYLQDAHRFHYGRSVVDVVRRAGLPWRWNWRALADLTSLEHCVEGETLHADVRKVRPGSVVAFDGFTTSVWQLPWEDRVQCDRASPQSAVDALLESCRLYADRDLVLSMSAGMDSRLLLACMLAIGVKPRIITMGDEASTDSQISAAVAKRFGLPFSRIPIAAADYLASSSPITGITSGTKSFQNWHTYVYAAKAGLRADDCLIVGSNGEAARTYYLDKGIASQMADKLDSTAISRMFWRRKLRSIFTAEELALLNPKLAREFTSEGLDIRRERMRQLCPGTLLSGLDTFYAEQRLPNFIANGLALVNAHVSTVTPMLHHEWTSQIWNLPRRWKLGSRWHRFAIQRLCPALLEFEEEKTGEPMRPTPRLLYWLAARNRARHSYFVNYADLFRDHDVASFIRETSAEIAPVADPALSSTVMSKHQAAGDRARTLSFIASIQSFLRYLRDQNVIGTSTHVC